MTGGGGSAGEGMLTALVAAASNGRVEQARALLQANPLLATTRDAQGWTPGLLAAYYDQPDVLELCLAKGAPVNDVDADTYKASALHWLAGHGRAAQVISLVTQHGADPNLRDAEGQTPLHCACRNDHPLTVLALLVVGADPGVETLDGERPAQATGSRLARGFLRMAERACGQRVLGAAWKSKNEEREGLDAVAMGAVYGRGYQSGELSGEKEREQGASPSTRSTGSSSLSLSGASDALYDDIVGSDDSEEEEEHMLLVESEVGDGEEDEEALLLGSGGRWRRRSSAGRYRIVV